MLNFVLHALLILSPLVWVAVIAIVVGACRSAARADRQPRGLRSAPSPSEREGALG